MQVGGVGLNDALLSESLSGNLNLWKNWQGAENESLPTETYAGHMVIWSW